MCLNMLSAHRVTKCPSLPGTEGFLNQGKLVNLLTMDFMKIHLFALWQTPCPIWELFRWKMKVCSLHWAVPPHADRQSSRKWLPRIRVPERNLVPYWECPGWYARHSRKWWWNAPFPASERAPSQTCFHHIACAKLSRDAPRSPCRWNGEMERF